LNGFYTVLSREMLTLRRRFLRYVLSGMVNPLLLLVAFGWGLGRGIHVEGMDYLQFIVPGIIALSGMNTSFSTVGVPLNISRRYTKTLEVYLTSPISPSSIALVIRGLISSIIIAGLGFIFGAKLSLSILVLGIIILNCFLFASLGLYIGLTLWSHEDMTNFTTVVLLPMTFLGGTFFPLQNLPTAVSGFIYLLPLTHASTSLRAAMLGLEVSWASALVLIGYSSLFFYLGTRAINRGDLT
jgi:ABC-type multidrug transport system permease subunit